MPCNGTHRFEPARVLVYRVYSPEGFIDIRIRGDHRGPLMERSIAGFPIEWISPAPMLVSRTSTLLQLFQKMNGLGVMLCFAIRLRQICKTHRVVGIGNRKPERLCEKAPRGWNERFRKNHRRH